MEIRKAISADYDGVWAIFEAVIQAGDSFVFEADFPKSDLAQHWFAPYMDTFVAVESGEIVGSYVIKPKQLGRGSHIANCSYMSDPNVRGKGIGEAMCRHSIEWGRARGYVGIQFNIVVSTNSVAVRVWERCGFRIIGTTPKGFRHPTLGLVDTYIMYLEL